MIKHSDSKEFIKEWRVKKEDIPRFFEALGYPEKDYDPEDCYSESMIAIQDYDMEDYEQTYERGLSDALNALQIKYQYKDLWIDTDELLRKDVANFGKFTFTSEIDIEWTFYLLDITP